MRLPETLVGNNQVPEPQAAVRDKPSLERVQPAWVDVVTHGQMVASLPESAAGKDIRKRQFRPLVILPGSLRTWMPSAWRW